LKVAISVNYPSIRIPFHIKREADVQARSDINGSRLYRLLIAAIFTNDELWASSNAKTLIETRHDHVYAVFGNILTRFFILKLKILFI
jgi:hypothetical protein